MTSISHTSVPFQISLPVTTCHSRPKTRQARLTGGLQLIPDACSSTDAAKVSTGMLHASYLAGAALNAAARWGYKPFNYCFRGNLRTANIVVGVMNRIIQSYLGQCEPIGVSCEDVKKHCRTSCFGFNRIAGHVTHDEHLLPTIILCPHGLSFPPNPPPCSARPGTVSIDYLLLHEMTHVLSISGLGRVIHDETGTDARDVANAILAGKDTTTDANVYAFLGTWAWDLGLGGPPWNLQRVPLERFFTGQFRASSSWG